MKTYLITWRITARVEATSLDEAIATAGATFEFHAKDSNCSLEGDGVFDEEWNEVRE